MDASLLSQLLFRAKKKSYCVQLRPAVDSHGYIVIDPEDDWDIKSDSLVTENEIIDLNTIVSAVLIHKYDILTNKVPKIEYK